VPLSCGFRLMVGENLLFPFDNTTSEMTSINSRSEVGSIPSEQREISESGHAEVIVNEGTIGNGLS
jgi:hypothetical protein